MKITKRFTFSASHRLCNPGFTVEENKEMFDACYGPHGHNFTLEVMVEGPIDKNTGMVINFHELKRIVTDNALNHFDHRDFDSIPEFKNKVQTVENLAGIIWKKLAGKMPKGVRLSLIRIAETNDNWVEYSGS